MNEYNPYAKVRAIAESKGYNWAELIAFTKTMMMAVDIEYNEIVKLAKEENKDKRRKRVAAFVNGKKIGEWGSRAEAARELQVNACSISNCCRGKLFTAGKYKGKKISWEFVE